MKKYIKIVALVIATFFVSTIPAFAKTLTVEQLKDEIEKLVPDAGNAYIIGNYVFTSKYSIELKDIVLASTTVTSSSKTNPDAITIYQLQREYDDMFEPTGWKEATPVLGSGKIPDSIDIRYIDYNHLVEKSSANIELDLNNTKYATYTKTLKDALGFEKQNFYGEDLKITDGKVTGLLLQKSVDDISYNDADKVKFANAKYFFAYIIEVPGATKDTTIHKKHFDNTEKDVTTASFDVKVGTEGQTPGIVSLVAIDPKTWDSTSKTITITVDLDGKGDYYDPADYVIDLSELKFQATSEVSIDYKEDEISQADINELKDWGYTSFGENKLYIITPVEGTNNEYKATGKVVLQSFKANTWSKEAKDGYFILYNIKKPDDLAAVPDSVVVKVGEDEIETFDKSYFNDQGVMTVLSELNHPCDGNGKTCKINITVDWDGDGIDYKNSDTITIDYSGLTFEKSSKFSIESVSGNEDAKEGLKDDFGWEEPDYYNLTFATDGSNVKVTGLLTILDKFEGNQNPFEGEDATGYYLPYVIKLTENKHTENNKTTVLFMHEGEEDKTVTADDFDGNQELYVLRHLHRDDSDKTFTVIVDMDGDGDDYAPYKITVDWSELVLQEPSPVIPSAESTTEQTKQKMESEWGYIGTYNENIRFELQENNTFKLTGLVREQVLNDDVYGKDLAVGYYFDFTFVKPEGVDSSKAIIKSLNSADENSVKKEFQKEDYDENGNLTILKRLDPTTACQLDGSNCKLYYSVDWDGDEGHRYVPAIYTIDYRNLTFEKSSIFEVTPLTDGTKVDENDLLDAEKGYSISVTHDDQDPTIYHVSGVLPKFEDEDWTEGTSKPDFNGNGSLLYYLGLGLKLVNAPQNYGTTGESAINVLFEHDALANEFTKKIDSEDFGTSKTVYILKALKASGTDSSALKPEDKYFDITVDLDGDSTVYAPYTVRVDYSGIIFQDDSKGYAEVGEFDQSELESHEPEKNELDGYGFKFEADAEVTVSGDKISGTIREQSLDNGFMNNTGYFVPVKIMVPINEEWFEPYKDKWTVALYDENGEKKAAYKPNENERNQGWALALLRLNRDKNGNKVVKYEVDFDGEEKAFLPYTYEISYEDLIFKSENEVSYEFFDETTGQVETKKAITYEGDTITDTVSSDFENYAYHDFDYWYKDNSETPFDFETTTTGKDENITLKAHWTLDIDSFLVDVINDLNDVESTITKNYSNIFEVVKDGNTITFKVLDSVTPLSEMNNTSIPGAIAYILQRGEVQGISLQYEGQTVEFTKTGANNTISAINLLPASLDEDGKMLKQSIQAGAKKLFETVLGSEEEQNMTLNNMAVNNKGFTLTIGDLIDGVALSEEALNGYTFNFETEVTAVKSEEELKTALENSSIKYIDIADNFNINTPHTISTEGLTIKSSSESTFTLTGSEGLENMFDVTSTDVTIKNLNLKTVKNAGIVVESSGSLTTTSVNFTNISAEGSKAAGVEVKAGGTFNGSNLTYTDESYSKPLVKAEAGSTVNVTNTSKEQATPVKMQEVKRYEEGTTGVYIGDSLIDKPDYNYQNYYNDAKIANNFFSIRYSGERTITSSPMVFTRYYDVEEGKTILPPEKLKGLTTYEDDIATYSIEYWVHGDKQFKPDQVPAPTENTYYGADLKPEYKEGVEEVTDKDGLIKAVGDEGTSNIVIVNGEIDLEDTELEIKKQTLLITGKCANSETLGTIKGKIKVTSDDVKLDKINIVGVTSNKEDETQNVITVTGTGFSTWQANVTAEALDDGKYWNSLIQFTEKESPVVSIYFSKFNGANAINMIDFENKMGDKSSIVGNDLIGSEETKEFILIDGFDDNSTVYIRQQTATFVGENEYGIRIEVPANVTHTTINLGSFWSGKMNQKLKIALDLTDSNYNTSGFTFTAGKVFEDSIELVYVKPDGSTSEHNPYGESLDAKLIIE